MTNFETKFPPYGFMNVVNQKDLTDNPPPDWQPPERLRGRKDAWTVWRQERADEIRDALWPVFVAGSGWQGQSAALMEELTRTDLKLLLALQAKNPLND